MLQIDPLEATTRYRKAAQKRTPPKADHKHEYFVLFATMVARLSTGFMAGKTWRFYLRPTCIDCGHQKRRTRTMKFVEIEITPAEWKKLKDL